MERDIEGLTQTEETEKTDTQQTKELTITGRAATKQTKRLSKLLLYTANEWRNIK